MKRNLMNELTEGMDALDTISKYKKEMEEIEQILGKALGYPWFKDDQENFPNATEADGVSVGDHTAWSLACEAADKIKEQKEEISGLHAELEYYRVFAEQLGAKKAVSEKQQWEKCADKLFTFAEIVQEVEGNDVRNPDYYNSACEAIKEYNRLKSNV